MARKKRESLRHGVHAVHCTLVLRNDVPRGVKRCAAGEWQTDIQVERTRIRGGRRARHVMPAELQIGAARPRGQAPETVACVCNKICLSLGYFGLMSCVMHVGHGLTGEWRAPTAPL